MTISADAYKFCSKPQVVKATCCFYCDPRLELASTCSCYYKNDDYQSYAPSKEEVGVISFQRNSSQNGQPPSLLTQMIQDCVEGTFKEASNVTEMACSFPEYDPHDQSGYYKVTCSQKTPGGCSFDTSVYTNSSFSNNLTSQAFKNGTEFGIHGNNSNKLLNLVCDQGIFSNQRLDIFLIVLFLLVVLFVSILCYLCFKKRKKRDEERLLTGN